MKRRNRKKADEGVDESWLLPYADLLTLLLALFIVLFSMSEMDSKSLKNSLIFLNRSLLVVEKRC